MPRGRLRSERVILERVLAPLVEALRRLRVVMEAHHRPGQAGAVHRRRRPRASPRRSRRITCLINRNASSKAGSVSSLLPAGGEAEEHRQALLRPRRGQPQVFYGHGQRAARRIPRSTPAGARAFTRRMAPSSSTPRRSPPPGALDRLDAVAGPPRGGVLRAFPSNRGKKSRSSRRIARAAAEIPLGAGRAVPVSRGRETALADVCKPGGFPRP